MKKVEIELPLINKDDFYGSQCSQYEYFSRGVLNNQELKRLKQLEGQCRIAEWQFLQTNYPKAIFFAALMTVSVVGLFLLKYFKSLRAKLLYSQLDAEQLLQATHIYVKGTDRNQEICGIEENAIQDSSTKVFQFKHLKYEFIQGEPYPLSWHFVKKLESSLSERFLKQGLSTTDAQKRQAFYGRNEHRVQVPGYFEFLFDTMTKPFFIFQYFVCVIYILEKVTIFGVLMIFFSWLTTSINYFLLRRSYQKIKETAEKQFKVKVLRNGAFYYISNIDLVPGDLYEPGEQTPCDSIVVKGELFVDEASLTGENVPIAKFRLTHPQNREQSCHWMFEGSKIQTMKEHTLAMAINVGYTSRRGRIIRKILTKIPKQPQIFNKLIYFLVEAAVLVTIVFLATLAMFMSTNIQRILVLFRFFDYVSCAFHAAYPIYFNLAYSFCLVRLHRDGILGTQCEKTVESGRMKTLCFDKTGTLTQAKMEICNIFHIKDEQTLSEVAKELKGQELICGLFGCCNSVEVINGEPKGDEIDLQMFLHSEARIQPSSRHQVIRNIAIGGVTWEILKIHQYESKFQSMSILARNLRSQQCFVFAKGSPEMIHESSRLKYERYDEFIKRLSLEGYRSIAFGYREVPDSQVQELMSLDRVDFLRGISILGVVTFVNLLKEDARETIQTLTECCINTKIITGDNIFLGIQTAILTGMIPPSATVAVLEGKRYEQKTSGMDVLFLSKDQGGNFVQSIKRVVPFRFSSQEQLFYAVDNDFVRVRQDFLHNKIKVFARISPENKALIVRRHKEVYDSWRKKGSFRERLFRDCGYKVGMVGDGANDLIAIKDADVGIGINSTDAVYSASFAVNSLNQINEIVREAKNTQRQLVDIVHYFGACSIIGITQSLILAKDASYPTSIMLIYRNFATILIIALFLGLSRPAQRLTKYLVSTNFMGLENHLVFWGNILIASLGLCISYVYYENSSDFEPNPRPTVTFAEGSNGICKSASIVFLCSNIVYVFLGLFVYRSSPWKEPLYRNKPFSVTIFVNVLLILPMFFLTKQLSILDLVEIGQKEAAICLILMLATMGLIWLYNYLIQKRAFHTKQERDQQALTTEILQENKTSVS